MPWIAIGKKYQQRAWALLHDHGIETEIRWIPGHSGIPGNEEADRQANVVRGGRGSSLGAIENTEVSTFLFTNIVLS